jgi:Asp-tRNA(Asn)/Glu-tRNA(Gln) amidotransferase A subunit family amidase
MGDWEERLGRTATEEDVEPLTWALVGIGRALNGGQYLKSVQELQRIARTMAAVFEDIDVLLTPTLGEPPLELGSFDSPADNPLAGLFRAASFVPFTPPFNVSGQPAVSLPLHWNDAGLPIGVQFAGRYGDEETLISLSAQLEQASPWADRRPPVHA